MTEADLTEESMLVNLEEKTSEEKTSENEDVKWWYDNDIPGKGDVPDYYISSKYKNLAEQAKAYNEAQKMLGGMTGAPEKYEFKLADDILDKVEFDEEDPLVNQFKEYAKSKNFSQETFSDLLNLLAYNLVQDLEDQDKRSKTLIEEEKKSLGKDAETRVAHIANWAKTNIPEEFKTVIRDLGRSAKGIMFLEHISNQVISSPIPISGSSSNAHDTKERLRKLVSDPRLGRDKEYDEYVKSQYEEYYGK